MKSRGFSISLLLALILWVVACATPPSQLFETPPGRIPISDNRLFAKALAYHKKGRTDLAMDLWKKFLERHPGSFEARNNLGLLYYANDQISLAISQFERALDLEPGSAKIKRVLLRALKVRVAILEENKEYDDVIVDLKRIFKLSPQQAREKIALRVGKFEDVIFEKVKKIDTLEGYQRFLEKYPDQKNSNEARRRVRELKQDPTSSLDSLSEAGLETDLPEMQDTVPEGFEDFTPELVPELVVPPLEETIEIVTEPFAPVVGSSPEADLETDLPAMESTVSEGFAPEPIPEIVAPLPEETIEIVTEPSAPLIPAPSEPAEPEPVVEPPPVVEEPPPPPVIAPQLVVPSKPVPEQTVELERVSPKVVEVVKVKTRLNVRSEPEIRGGNIVYKLKLGERIPVLRENESWYQVEYVPGKSGWISKSYSKLPE
jgi:outer membrane protein assembly factor BamD (BamD/ComL family)